MVRYNEALDKSESGRNEKREQDLLQKFNLEQELTLTTPATILDSGNRIIAWYLPSAMTETIIVGHQYIIIFWVLFQMCMQNDMYFATESMDSLLKQSISTGKSNRSNWRTDISNFHPSPDGKITPGCINISPAWFQQGREVPTQLIAANNLTSTQTS